MVALTGISITSLMLFKRILNADFIGTKQLSNPDDDLHCNSDKMKNK